MKSLSNADRSKLAIGGLLLAVVIFVAVNVFSNAMFRGVQADLTANNLFTLSEGTKQVLDDIDEPITVRLYFSKVLGESNPRHKAYYTRVRELLERYQDLSEGMIRLELYDPAPFTDEEDRAVAFGLQALPVSETGDKGYFGVAATNSTDDLETIAYLSPEREPFLEYDLTKIVYNLTHPEKRRIGIISGLPIMGSMNPRLQQQMPRWTVVEQLEDFFEVQNIPISDKHLPNDLDALMLIHPRGMTKEMRYAVDQFVLRGGKVFVALDPIAEFDIQMNRGAPGSGTSELPDLLAAWGVEMVSGKVVGDMDTARRVNVSRGGEMSVADYLLWLSLGPDNFDPTNAVTGDVAQLNMATAGALRKIEGAETKVAPLIQVGKESGLIAAEKARVNPDVAGIFRDFKPSGEKHTLAMQITGPAQSAFPEGQPNKPEDAKSPEEGGYQHVNESVEPVNVIVVADTDFLHDRFWAETRQLAGQRFVVPYANNADFVINAMENLLGGSALSDLRGRGETNRPFLMVQEIRQEAERQYQAKEQRLQQELTEVRGRLETLLQRQDAAAGTVLSDEERQAIEEFRSKMISIRQELRDVQRALREDIDRLDALLKFLNIAAIPLLLGLIALVVAVARRVRRPKAA